MWKAVARYRFVKYDIIVAGGNVHAARMAAVSVCHNYWPRGGWHIMDVSPSEVTEIMEIRPTGH